MHTNVSNQVQPHHHLSCPSELGAVWAASVAWASISIREQPGFPTVVCFQVAAPASTIFCRRGLFAMAAS